ncbi:MAG: hypothetical protein WBD92_08490, partial [Methylovirgula sp.]
MSAAREFFPDIFPCQIFRVRLDAAQLCASKGDQMMYQAVTLDAIFVWFVWGFFMALGWVLG